MDLSEFMLWVSKLESKFKKQLAIASEVIKEIQKRIQFLLTLVWSI